MFIGPSKIGVIVTLWKYKDFYMSINFGELIFFSTHPVDTLNHFLRYVFAVKDTYENLMIDVLNWSFWNEYF